MSNMTQHCYRVSIATIFFILIACIPINAQQVPPAPSQDYDRLGSYFWTTTYKAYERLNIDSPGPNCSGGFGQRQPVDTLSVGRDLVASLGSRTIRVVIGNYGERYPQGYEPGVICPGTRLTLKQWVQSSEYQALFNDQRFSTYILTYFTGSFDWSKSVTSNGQRFHTPPGNYNSAHDQVKELIEHLVGQENGSFRFPGKTFILVNWEADSEFSYVINDPKFISATASYNPSNPVYGSFWVEYEKLIRAASQGAKDAVRPSGTNQPKAYFGVEFSTISRFVDPFSGNFTFVKECGGGNSQSPDDRMEWRCVMSYLPQRLNQTASAEYVYTAPASIDYWSYSSYESTRSPLLSNPDVNLAKRVRGDLNNALQWISINRTPQYQANNLIIGEFGFSNNSIIKSPLRVNEGEGYSGKFIQESLNAFKAFGVSYVIHFQGTDAIDPGDFQNIPDFSLFTGTNAFFSTTYVKTAAGESFTKSNTADVVWMEDDPQTSKQTYPSGTWHDLTSTSFPRPLSGSKAFQTDIHTLNAPDGYAYYFQSAPQQLTINTGDTLFAYVYIDPINPPSEIMLQWNDGNWEHRAYWGQTIITWGTDGTASSRRIGDLPPTGKWVRLEVPANIVGLDGSTINGFSVALSNGRVAFDRAGKITGELVWADDNIAGGQQHTYVECGCSPYPWGEITNNPLPVSGTKAFQTGILAGYTHTQYFDNATQMKVNAGDNLFVYAYLDPANPPETIMMQWHEAGGNWEHRAYWGKADKITWAADGTAGNYYMGPLPPLGQWVRLEVLADRIGLGGRSLDGFGLALHSGRAAWDRVGKVTRDVLWLDDNADIPTANRFADGGDSWNSPTITSPISGNNAFQTVSASGLHQIYTANLSNTLTVNTGDTLFAYVYLDPDPNNKPSTLMFQWNDGNWEHRAYWGEDNLIPWGDKGPIDSPFNSLYTSVGLTPLNYRPGTASYRFMGAVPETGKWVRIEIPASRVGLEGSTLNGFAFTLYGGRGVFDRVGKVKNEHLDQ